MKVNDELLLINAFLRFRSEAAFRKLYQCYSPAMYQMALNQVDANREVAAEILQIAWIRVAEKLSSYERKSTFKTWLLGIVINCCREHRKLDNKNELLTNFPIPDSSSTMLDEKIDISRALIRLPLGYRQVLILHDIEGYKHSEISGLLGINEGTSKSQLFHARRALRQLLNL